MPTYKDQELKDESGSSSWSAELHRQQVHDTIRELNKDHAGTVALHTIAKDSEFTQSHLNCSNVRNSRFLSSISENCRFD
jgi:hypothetical protein